MRRVWVVIPLVLIGIIGTVVLVETTKDSGPEITFSTNKEIYEIGEPVSIIMENTGNVALSGSSSPCGFRIFDENGNGVKSFWGAYLAVCTFERGEKISKTWSSKSYDGTPVQPGIYTLQAKYFETSHEKQIELVDSNNSFELLHSPTSSENIKMLKDSELVFSGKVISKIPGTSVPDFYTINFKVIENFRNAKEDTVTVYTNERVWRGCAGLEENLEYLIFVSTKYNAMTCYHAISLPTEITDELSDYSSQIPWWTEDIFPSDKNVGEILWSEKIYSVPGTGLVRVIDKDMNLDSEKVENFTVKVWSSNNPEGIEITVTETNASTGVFEGTVVFVERETEKHATEKHHLQVVNGEKLIAVYHDYTIPETLNVPFRDLYATGSRILND